MFKQKVVFALFKFPSVSRNNGKQEEWIRLLKRENKEKNPTETIGRI